MLGARKSRFLGARFLGKRRFLGTRKSEKAVKSGPMALEKRSWEGQERPWFLGEKAEERGKAGC
ncbi:hypothetical protein ATY36_18170 [Vibrio cidicii]|nr:hypothetical protein ATY36_18170 [Vibrio cidicii]